MQAGRPGPPQTATRSFDDPAVIPLCVPYTRAGEARRAGGSFDAGSKSWFCDPADAANPDMHPFLPYRFRPDRSPPFIRPWMVPQALWGRNLRALLSKEDWDRIRKDTYVRAGYRCRVCGGKGPDWPVEADEGWHYDDQARVQTLRGVIALCPKCHDVRHWGKTMREGRADLALAWMAELNCWSIGQATACANRAMEEWSARSQWTDWRCDIEWATRFYGVTARQDGEMEARRRNSTLVDLARKDHQRSPTPSHGSHLRHLFMED